MVAVEKSLEGKTTGLLLLEATGFSDAMIRETKVVVLNTVPSRALINSLWVTHGCVSMRWFLSLPFGGMALSS